MVRTFLNTYKVSFAEHANIFIYFLKKLPFIGKKIPEELYRKTTAKLVIGIILEIFSFLFGFVGKAIYVGLMIILPAVLIAGETGEALKIGLHIFFFLSIFMGPIVNALITENQTTAFKMIKLMRVEPKNYFKSRLIYKRGLNFIHFLPVMMIVLSPIKGLILTIELIGMKFLGEVLQLFIHEKFKFIPNMKIWFSMTVMGVGLLLGYLLPIIGFTIDFSKVLFSGVGIFIIVILSAISLVYIFTYKYYNEVFKVILISVAKFDKDTIMAEATFSDIKINEKKFTAEDLNSKRFENKSGYEYLNAIFFMRHRKILTAATKRRTIIVLVLSILAVGFVLWTPAYNEKILKLLQESGPIWVFIMYMMSTSSRVCKAMFYNCDASLLRYGYYREGKVIISNFKARLKRIVVLNLIPAIATCIGLTAVIISARSPHIIVNMIPIFVSILCLSCFFSIHYLFLYYVLQPYTAQLTVKSPLFSIINSQVYILSYMCLKINGSSYLFSIGVIGITIIYIVVALLVTYKVAPKTFKLR